MTVFESHREQHTMVQIVMFRNGTYWTGKEHLMSAAITSLNST